MNKKFLSAILFGALMVSSTGTFVSCKDYDDDIDQINKELTDIKSAIAALQAKVDGGKYVTNVVKNGNGITVTWNDNSTSTIETIKGDKGENGKDGTVVTIVDGFWAFDGVKSEYPAKGDKGDKGDKGEAGAAGAAAAAGHDAKISEDGYWMVWNAEKGEYTKTEYIAGGATAVKGEHGWTIRMKDEKGNEQSIYIPNSADLVSIQDAKDSQAPYNGYDIYYGLVKTPVDWDGTKAVNGKMEAGMYPVLSKDVQVMLNPTGVDGTAYKFDFRDSDNKEPWGLSLGEIRPYTGSKLTRATVSESGVWVLPRHIERIELNKLDERADYITQFRTNSGQNYAFALNATSKEDASKVIKSQYIYSFDPTNIGDMKATEFSHSSNPVAKDYYIWGQEHRPNFENYIWTSQSGSVEWLNVDLDNVIYDYKLEIDKTKMTQVQIDKYGLKISDDKYKFSATKEAAVDNRMYFKLSYILVNGSKGTVDFYADIVAKDIVVVDNNIGTIDEAFNAEWTTKSKITPLNNRFVYGTTLPVDLIKALGNNYDEWIDAMYNALVGHTDTDKAYILKNWTSILGGDPINNDATYNNSLIRSLVYFDYLDANNKSCIYDVKDKDLLAKLAEIKTLKVYFIAGTYIPSDGTIAQRSVTTPYYTVSGDTNYSNGFAIPLNNAFSVQVGAGKEDMVVGALNFKFQLTQPENEKMGIPHTNGKFTKWVENENGSTLYSFGAYTTDEMFLPLHEAFGMWIAEGDNAYKYKKENAKYYGLRFNYFFQDESGITFMGNKDYTLVHYLSELNYQGDWTKYTTYADKFGGVMARALDDNSRAIVPVDASYHFFGVYPSTQAELGFYTDAWGVKHAGFNLVFASTIKESTLKVKENIYYANANSNDVFISNDDITAKTFLNGDFVLFDGLNAAKTKKASRADLNKERGFNESQRLFAAPKEYEITAKYVGGTTTTTIDVEAIQELTATDFVEDARGVRSYKINSASDDNKIKVFLIPAIDEERDDTANPSIFKSAHTSGFAIQLGNKIEDRQPIEVSIKVKDALGFYNVLKVKVQKLQ